MEAVVRKSRISGTVSVPGSKSHTIRALCIATMSEGVTRIQNPLRSRDGLAALSACRAFGAEVIDDGHSWIVKGLGKKLGTVDNIINADNSGTTLYFVTVMAATLPTWTVITGDESIRSRPIIDLLEQLKTLGAEAFTTKGNKSAPAVLKGPIKAGLVRFSGKMSQYVSGMLLASPLLEGVTRIELDEPKEKPYLQMTLDWMERHGISVEHDKAYKWFEVAGPQMYKALDEVIPSDWEAVAFPLAAAIITDSEMTIEELDTSGSQGDAEIVDVLTRMGAKLELDEKKGTLTIKRGSSLNGIEIDCSDIPDAVPMLSAIGCFCSTPLYLTGLEMVRAKETDRVAVMKEELTKLGARVEDTETTMTVYPSVLKGARVDSHGDHRVAMALAVAGFAIEGETIIEEAEAHDVSYPGFFDEMRKLGGEVDYKQR